MSDILIRNAERAYAESPTAHAKARLDRARQLAGITPTMDQLAETHGDAVLRDADAVGFRLLTWDTYTRDHYGKSVIGYAVARPGEEFPFFGPGEDYSVAPSNAVDSDATLRTLLVFMLHEHDEYDDDDISLCALDHEEYSPGDAAEDHGASCYFPTWESRQDSVFMLPQVEHGTWVSTEDGLVPLEYFDTGTHGSREEDTEDEQGYCGRLSAPGYMDCTDWLGPFETPREAREAILETHEVCPLTGRPVW